MNKLDQLLEFIKTHPLLLLVVGAVLLAVIFKILKPKIKDYICERIVSLFLLFLTKKEYKIIYNVQVFYNGMMLHVYHVIVSAYGVFGIETKNYKG